MINILCDLVQFLSFWSWSFFTRTSLLGGVFPLKWEHAPRPGPAAPLLFPFKHIATNVSVCLVVSNPVPTTSYGAKRIATNVSVCSLVSNPVPTAS